MSKTRTRSSSMDNTNDSIPNSASDPLLDYTDSRLSTTTKDTIELLYLWINRDKTGFIREQGFNFSPNYRFDLKATNDGKNYELSCTTNLDYPNVWITRNILNLTAVVGENGSGKTLLLGHLSRLSLYPIFTDRRPDYMRWIDEKNRKNKTIQAYCFNGVVYIYHNFPAGELQNNTPFHVISINESDPGRILEKTNMQTRIYITNGQTYSNLVTESAICGHQRPLVRW